MFKSGLKVTHLSFLRGILVKALEPAAVRRCSLKRFLNFFSKTHRKAPVLESLFNKLAGLRAFLTKVNW